jgi:DNA-binding response OmpR family regulator
MEAKPLKVLLVEDNIGDVALFRDHLRAEEGRYQFGHAGTVGQAEDLLAKSAFDVIFLDLHLPDSHGLETVQRINGASPHTPIVVLTSMGDTGLDVEALRHGAQDYLVKTNINPELVLRATRYAIERKRIEQQLKLAKQELQDMNDHLERMVEQRTAKMNMLVKALETDVQQRKSAEAEVLAAKGDKHQRLTELLNNAPLAIWAVDAAGVCTLAQGRLQPFGQLVGATLGRHLMNKLGDCPELQKCLEAALSGTEGAVTAASDGRTYQFACTPTRTADGKITGAVYVCTDLTALLGPK